MSSLSEALNSIPSLQSIPAGRQRFLAQILLIAFLSVTEERNRIGLGTDDFIETLEDAGFHIDVTDRHLLVSVAQ